MSIGKAIGTILASDSGITDICPAARIRRFDREQGTPVPALVFTQVSAPRVPTMAAASGIVEGRWQIDAYATEGEVLTNLLTQVREALGRYTGTPTGSGTEILYTELQDEIELGLEPAQGDAKQRVLHAVQDYKVTWRE